MFACITVPQTTMDRDEYTNRHLNVKKRAPNINQIENMDKNVNEILSIPFNNGNIASTTGENLKVITLVASSPTLLSKELSNSLSKNNEEESKKSICKSLYSFDLITYWSLLTH